MRTVVLFTPFAEHLQDSFQQMNGDQYLLTRGKTVKNQYFFSPDGAPHNRERYMRIDGLDKIQSGDGILVVHCGYPKISSGETQDNGLQDITAIGDVLRREGIPRRILFPSFAYGQQDSVFRRGEPNIALDRLRMFKEYYGFDLIGVDLHFFGRDEVDRYIEDLTALPLLEERIRYRYPGALLIGADGSVDRRLGIVSARKERFGPGDSRTIITKGLVRAIQEYVGSEVFEIDDLTLSGGTLYKLAEALKSKDYGFDKRDLQFGAALTHLPSELTRETAKKLDLGLIGTNSLGGVEEDENVQVVDIFPVVQAVWRNKFDRYKIEKKERPSASAEDYEEAVKRAT